jgi:hypothetical protein
MAAPLNEITIPSIYKNRNGQRVPLPKRMAQCTPDMEAALRAVAAELGERGGKLVLSDMFRTYDMQLQSHLDYVSGKKTAYSPPPGGSLHEAGRALDLDLGSLGIKLSAFWELARPLGLSPIIDQPISKMNEAWHFDCRGSHQIVYKYYQDGSGANFKPYAAMAASAILAIGVQVDAFTSNQEAAAIQGGLIRLGQTLGNIDGSIGRKTKNALDNVGVPFTDPRTTLRAVEDLLRLKFPEEYETDETFGFREPPDHVIQ